MSGLAGRITTGRLPRLGGLRRLVVRWLRFTTTVTWAGWIVVAMALLLGAVTWYGSWAETRVGAIGLGLLLAWSVLWALGRSRLLVAINLGSPRIVVGDHFVAEIEVTNHKRLSLRPIMLQVPVGKANPTFTIPALGSQETHTEAFVIPTKKRGVIGLGPITSVRGDALGLVKRTQTWSDQIDLYVHPKTVYVPVSLIGSLRDIEGISTQTLTSSDVSFHALREYQPGDDKRSIHWKTTARVGELMVRQFEETRRAHLLCLLSINRADYAHPQEFEHAISVVASLAIQTMNEGKHVTVVTQQEHIKTSTPHGLLDRLTEIEALAPDSQILQQLPLSTVPLFALAQSGLVRAPDASVVCMVAGTANPPPTFVAARKHLPLSMTAYGLRCQHDPTLQSSGGTAATVETHDPNQESEPRSVRHSSGDITIFTVAKLNHLPGLVRGMQA